MNANQFYKIFDNSKVNSIPDSVKFNNEYIDNNANNDNSYKIENSYLYVKSGNGYSENYIELSWYNSLSNFWKIFKDCYIITEVITPFVCL